jgi:hypothetical protein
MGGAAAQDQRLKPKLPSAFMQQCRFDPDTDRHIGLSRFSAAAVQLKPVASAKQGAENPDEDQEDDEEDDEEEDEAEDADEEDDDEERPIMRFASPTPSPAMPCYRINGSVGLTFTATGLSAGPGTRLDRISGRTQFESKATVGLHTLSDSELGRVRAALVYEATGTGETSTAALSEAWISVGPFTFGQVGSRFDFWSGDEFGFRVTAPSSNPWLAAVSIATGETSALTVSIEDPTKRRLGLPGLAGLDYPDVVARWRLETETLQVHLGAAMRHLRFSSVDVKTEVGFAAIAGVQLSLPSAGVDDYVLLQGVYADKAPGYLGIAQASGLTGLTLPSELLAEPSETARGWTGAIAYSHGWSERLRSNVFATYLDLTLPRSTGAPRIQVMRTAGNLVWTPVRGLDITFEAGVSRTITDATGLNLVRLFEGTRLTAQMAIARSF